MDLSEDDFRSARSFLGDLGLEVRFAGPFSRTSPGLVVDFGHISAPCVVHFWHLLVVFWVVFGHSEAGSSVIGWPHVFRSFFVILRQMFRG